MNVPNLRIVALMVSVIALGCGGSPGGGGQPVAPQTPAQKAEAEKQHAEMKAKMESNTKPAEAGGSSAPK